MQLLKSFTLLSTFVATAVIAAPPSERILEPRLIFPSGNSSTPGSLPSKDPFYVPPSGWQSKTNGAILASRQVSPSNGNAATAWQILLKTTDALGNPDHTVTTILVPKKAVSPPKIVSIQLPEDAASVDCAPSAALVKNSKSNFAIAVPFLGQGVDSSLQAGYYVNIPDHEGSRALVFVGNMEGHAVLDSLKAATKFPTAIPGVTAQTPIVMGGYSGGAHATAWASQLAPKYAPKLNILGQVIGGTPVNVTSILTDGKRYFTGFPLLRTLPDPFRTLIVVMQFFAGFAGAGVVGEYNAYPDLKEYIDANIYPNGTKYLADIQNNKCIAQVVLNYAGKDLFSFFKIKDPLNDPIPQKRLAENILGNDGSVLKIKTIMYHSVKDDCIPFQDAQKYATAQCAAGANLNFVVDQDQSHLGEDLKRANDFSSWILAFHNGTANSSCNSSSS
ncbi:hypothetical protein OC861_003252 [Tilletia horrida]|nr:hypothetical protein OC861_003252 [Tilletia horrida]